MKAKDELMNKKFGLFAFAWMFISCVVLLAQTGTSLRYIYDEEGQLIGVIDQNNNATVFTYDAAGNMISTDRLTVRGAIDIFFVNPSRGRAAVPPQPGTPVTIYGVGFSAVPTQNQVTFNGVPAVVDASTTTTIKTSVPAGATTGPVQVTAPLGTATSRSDFIVLTISVTVSPARAEVAIAQRQQFTAAVTEGGTVIGGGVVWSVNGIVGGNPSVGTITGTGLYTAPASLPPRPTVTVTATSVEDPTARENATVTIVLGIGPIYTPEVSFRIGTAEQFPMGPIATQETSYRIGTAEQILIGPIFTPVASYRIGTAEQILIGPIFTPVASFRIGTPEQILIGPIATQETSYRIGTVEQMVLAPVFDRGPSYTTVVVTGLSPSRVARGATDVSFTVMGRNFNGATALDFLLPGGVRDSNIAVASLTVSPDGTQLTARISVAGTASIGVRTVVVQTGVGPSTAMITGSNQIAIE
jgi:YD repeat-containing protein